MEDGEIIVSSDDDDYVGNEEASDTEYAQYSILPAEKPPSSLNLQQMTGEQYLGWVQQERARLPRVKAVETAVAAAKERLVTDSPAFSWNPAYDPVIEQFHQFRREHLSELCEEEQDLDLACLAHAPDPALLLSLSESQCLRLVQSVNRETAQGDWPYLLACRLSHPPHTPAAVSSLRRLWQEQYREDLRLRIILAGVFGQLDLLYS